jgi:hypothetical protein
MLAMAIVSGSAGRGFGEESVEGRVSQTLVDESEAFVNRKRSGEPPPGICGLSNE